MLSKRLKMVRVPRQKRSIETKERILDAAMRLFSAKGFHGTNSKEIAAEAGVSIGSFYSYYEDKVVLFKEVMGRSFTQGLEQFLGEFASAQGNFDIKNARELLRRYIQHLVSAHDFTTEFHREAAAMIFTSSEIRKIHDEQEALVLHHIAEYLRSLGDKVRVGDIDTAVLVIYRSVESVVHAIKFSGQEAYRENQDRIIDELTDMLVLYIFKS